jgi:hypothetical protein
MNHVLVNIDIFTSIQNNDGAGYGQGKMGIFNNVILNSFQALDVQYNFSDEGEILPF